MRPEHDRAQRRLAGQLAALGLQSGDRFVLLAGNAPVVVDLVLAGLRAGTLPVPLNARLPAPAVAALVDDADPAVVVTDEAHRDVAPQRRRHVLLDGDGIVGVAATAPRALPDWPLCRPMHYTSGTTGRSKGVHSGLLGQDLGRALAEDERAAWRFGPDDVHLVCGPLSHSGPLRFAVNTVLFGGRVEVLEGFDAGRALALIRDRGVTTAFMAPTLLRRLLEHDDATAEALAGFRLLAHAGAPTAEPLKRRALQRFPHASVWEFYGSTEGQCTQIGPDEWLRHPHSVGRARPGRRLEVRDGFGRTVPAGTVGTIWCTAPPHARFAYWRDPGKTAAAWDGEFFTVGDLGWVDEEGRLTLHGRRDDLVITGGVNVYPAEVEQVVLAHEDVVEGVIFGVPDHEWGERVCAAVVLRPGARTDADGLRAWLRERLAGFQTPKDVVILDALPRTDTGKILRRELRERLGP